MNERYNRYIEYIVNDIQAPYFKNMRDSYGLSPDEYEMVLSKIYNQPVTIMGRYVYDKEDNHIYQESSSGYWEKLEYDNIGKLIYYENSNGSCSKMKYDEQGNLIYREDSTGFWVKYEYDDQGNEIYSEDSNGYIIDRR